jgi:hypothetical protein
LATAPARHVPLVRMHGFAIEGSFHFSVALEVRDCCRGNEVTAYRQCTLSALCCSAVSSFRRRHIWLAPLPRKSCWGHSRQQRSTPLVPCCVGNIDGTGTRALLSWLVYPCSSNKPAPFPTRTLHSLPSTGRESGVTGRLSKPSGYSAERLPQCCSITGDMPCVLLCCLRMLDRLALYCLQLEGIVLPPSCTGAYPFETEVCVLFLVSSYGSTGSIFGRESYF